jgi:poly-beta-1,6-N-acetyl-D-glucosamine N-deacetylase
MRVLFCSTLFLWFMMSGVFAQVAVLCYHEVDKPTDAFAIDRSKFESHLNYLKENGYHFVSLDEYLAYTKGKLQLPEKSVMITFDDGYLSFYTKVYPLLQKYQVPAMLAVVTSWTDGEGKPTDVGDLASWDNLREMEASGLVTVVSHSHALHKNQEINPQGDLSSIAESHLYINNRYETELEYENRLNNDFLKGQEVFQEKLGHKAKAIVWPYGLYSGKAVEIALKNGMEATFLLDGGVNTPDEKSAKYAKRILINKNPGTKVLETILTKDHDEWNSKPLRMAQVDIDALYDENPQKFNQNIQELLNRMRENKIQLVALQAFADPDGDGNVDGVYFYNHEVPVVADAFSTVSNALLQDNINVVAWMPSLAIHALAKKDDSNLIQADGEKGWYKRMSPFDSSIEPKLCALYRDLSRYSAVTGILFQDDLYMNDFEDASSYGKAAYEKAFGKPLSSLDRNNTEEMNRWTKLKADRLTELSLKLAAAFKENRPNACIMRDIYSEPVLNTEASEWFAQDFADCLKNYDYTVVMAYPYMDKEKDPLAFLTNVANVIKTNPDTNNKVIIKIQSYDWDKEKWLSSKIFNDQIRTLKKNGVRNIGYYPDTFYHIEGK